MSLRRHSSRSRPRSRSRSRVRPRSRRSRSWSIRGRRKSPRSRRSPSNRKERTSPRRPRQTIVHESSSESSQSASRRSSKASRSFKASRSVSIGSSSPKGGRWRRRGHHGSDSGRISSVPDDEPMSASDDMKNMNSDEEEEWLEKRRLQRLQIQKKHETSQVLRSPSTTSAPSSGEKRFQTDSKVCVPTIAPGTPYLEVCTNEGDETDIFGAFVASPAPESPDDAPSSNAIVKDVDEKMDADEVLKKLGASDSESDGTLVPILACKFDEIKFDEKLPGAALLCAN